MSASEPPPGPSSGARLTRARRVHQTRRRRRLLLGPYSDLFGEPAWDLLIDLYVAAGEERRVSVSSACIAADVPATTGLRWIARLEARGLVVRRHDPADARRDFVELTPAAWDLMDAVLDDG